MNPLMTGLVCINTLSEEGPMFSTISTNMITKFRKFLKHLLSFVWNAKWVSFVYGCIITSISLERRYALLKCSSRTDSMFRFRMESQQPVQNWRGVANLVLHHQATPPSVLVGHFGSRFCFCFVRFSEKHNNEWKHNNRERHFVCLFAREGQNRRGIFWQ